MENRFSGQHLGSICGRIDTNEGTAIGIGQVNRPVPIQHHTGDVGKPLTVHRGKDAEQLHIIALGRGCQDNRQGRKTQPIPDPTAGT